MSERRALSGLRRAFSLCLVVCFSLQPVSAAELKAKSLENFRRYVHLTEAFIDSDLAKGDPFLWVDSLSAARRQKTYEQLKRGEVVIAKLETLENGKPLEDNDSLIHHWIGTVFIPGVQLQQAIDLAQDYDQHAERYSPDVMRSKILSRNGNNFQVFFRFYKKKVITVIHNTQHDIRYIPLSPTRLHTRTFTTRIAQVEDTDNPDGPEQPVGNDGGFLWRLQTYWRYLERDGGVYIQCESVSLTRALPPIIGKLIEPFVTSVPKESLQFTLATTRTLLIKRQAIAGN